MKILEADFRKELYKSLMEAGYEKAEAQQIVGVKYAGALKEAIGGKLLEMAESVKNNKFDVVGELDDLKASFDELSKVEMFIAK